MKTYSNNNDVNVFFAADDKYLPYLAVALASLSEHASEEYTYNVNILTKSFSLSSMNKLRKIVKPNIKLKELDISDKIQHIKEELSLRLRDYYSEAIYYRIFIPSMFPQLSRAVYLDSDIVLNDDVAKLYFTDIGENLVGAVTDESVISEPIFCQYVKEHIGLDDEHEYFNSGVLLMNLEEIRKAQIKEKFLHLLCKYNFKTVAPDQDYLNFLCKGRVKYLSGGWNKHAIEGRDIPLSELHIMHYNMFNKPWRYDGVQNENLFWDMAKRTPFEAELLSEKANYTDDDKARDQAAAIKLVTSAKDISKSQKGIAKTIPENYFTEYYVAVNLISV